MELNDKEKKYKVLIILLIILIIIPIISIVGLKIWLNVAVMSNFDTSIGIAQLYEGKPSSFNNHYGKEDTIINVLNIKNSSNEGMDSNSWFDIYTDDLFKSNFLSKDLYLVYADEEKQQPLYLVNCGENFQANTKYIVRFNTSTRIIKNIYAIMIDGYCEYNNWENENICSDSSCYKASTVLYNGSYYCNNHYDKITFVKCSASGCSQRAEKEYSDPFSKSRQSNIYCIDHFNSLKNKMDTLYPCVLTGFNCDENGEKYIIDYLRFNSVNRDGIIEGTICSSIDSYFCKKHFENELKEYNQKNHCYQNGCKNKPLYLLEIENDILMINGSSVEALRKVSSPEEVESIDYLLSEIDKVCAQSFVSCEDHYDKIISIFTENEGMDILNIREYRKTHPNTLNDEKCNADCNNKATHKIKGLFGSTEYYCDDHYRELNELLDFFEDEAEKLGISDEVNFDQFR